MLGIEGVREGRPLAQLIEGTINEIEAHLNNTAITMSPQVYCKNMGNNEKLLIKPEIDC